MLETTTTAATSVDDQYKNFKALLNAIYIAYNVKEEKGMDKFFDDIFKNLSSKNKKDKQTGFVALNKFLQKYAFPEHRFFLFWKYRTPITDKAILGKIIEKLPEQLLKKTTAQSLNDLLPEFLDNAYGKFQAFCVNKEQPEQPDATRGSGDIQFTKDPNGNIHIAVLGTNHVLATVQLEYLKKKLEYQNIDKSKVHIHLLCKSGQNAVIQEAYGAEFAEDTLGEDKEMYQVFENKGFAEVDKEHTVPGKYVGTEPTLEQFYEYCQWSLPKNLIFLCCPNTLNRQVADIKFFLAKNKVPQDIQDSIQFITFSQQETAKYLESLLNEIKYKKEKANEKEKEEYEKEEYIIKFFLEPKIILSSFFAEMAKELFAVLEMQKLNKGTGQPNILLVKPVEPLSSLLRSEKLLDEKLEGQNEETEQTQDTENGILVPVTEAIWRQGTGCHIM